MEHLLHVEEVLNVSGRGIVLVPWLPISRFEGKVFPDEVLLKFPNGTSRLVSAHFDIPRMSPPPKEYQVVCMLKDIEKKDVVLGTEVWAVVKNESV